MKGHYLVRTDNHKFFVDRKGFSRCRINKLTWGNIAIANPFNFYTERLYINTTDYIAGYMTLSKRAILPTLVYTEIQHGPVAINKQTLTTNLIVPDVDIYENKLVFKNGITIGSYAAVGLSNIFQPGDAILVSYPVNNRFNLQVKTYLLDSATFGNGYIDTQNTTIASAVIRVRNGIILVENVHYILHDRYIIFKNGVAFGSYISSGITEVLQQNDVIVAMMQFEN